MLATLATSCGTSSPDGADGGDGDGGVGDTPDASDVSDAGDGGEDVRLPVRPGVSERWDSRKNCDYKSALLFPGQDLHLLCEGREPGAGRRIIDCPVSDRLDSALCNDPFVPLEIQDPEGNSLPFSPIAMNDIGSGFTVVTARVAGDHPGFAVVDRVRGRVTDSAFFPRRTIQIGPDRLQDDFRASDAMSAALFKDYLAVSASFTAWRNGVSLGEHGAVILYPWNGSDGMVEKNEDGFGPRLFVTTQPRPTLFLQDDSDYLRIINNGDATGPAGVDSLRQIVNPDGSTRFEIDRSKNFLLGEPLLEPLVNAGVSPDRGTILLASGAKLIAVTPSNADNPVCNYILNAAGITATQWHRDGARDYAFVSTRRNPSWREDQIFRLVMREGCPMGPVSAVSVYGGDATISALDPAGRIFYQGLSLLNGHAITAIRFEVF